MLGCFECAQNRARRFFSSKSKDDDSSVGTGEQVSDLVPNEAADFILRTFLGLPESPSFRSSRASRSKVELPFRPVGDGGNGLSKRLSAGRPWLDGGGVLGLVSLMPKLMPESTLRPLWLDWEGSVSLSSTVTGPVTAVHSSMISFARRRYRSNASRTTGQPFVSPSRAPSRIKRSRICLPLEPTLMM